MRSEDRHLKEPLLSDDDRVRHDAEDFESRERHEGAAGQADVEAQQESKGNDIGVSVLFTTFIMLGDMLGLGSLTLPGVFARVGWIPALILFALCAIGTIYSGRLFTLMAEMVPNAHVFDDFGGKAMGNWGRRLTYATVYLTIFGEPIIFHLTSMEALQQIFYRTGLGQLAAALIVAAVMVPLGQIRGIEEVSAVAVLGIVGMVAALLIAAVKLCVLPRPESYRAPELVHRPSDVSEPLVGVFDMVFTWGGQVNWTRYLMSMRYISKFPRAVAGTTLFMGAIYLMIGCVGYQRLGSDFDLTKPVTSILPQDGWVMAANVGLLIHCIIAYMINLNIWTHLLLHLLVPAMNREGMDRSLTGRGAWALMSVIGVAISCLVSVTFPYFSTVMAIIAALGDLAGAYALPALFVLVMMRHRLPKWERWLCYAIIPLSLALSVVGIVSSVKELISKFRQQ